MKVSLSSGVAKRMSLAGAQHKLPVIYRDNTIFEPRGRAPSTHILKPDHPTGDYPHSVVNEYFVMKLADALKLGVPKVFRRYVPAPIYLIERFDRRPKSLYSWLVFNMLVDNSDAHLKNLSFLVTDRGIHLAPFYDLIAVGVYASPTFAKNNWPGTLLPWQLCGRTTFGKLTRATIVEAAAVLGINSETANRLLNAQLSRIGAHADALLTALERENSAGCDSLNSNTWVLRAK